VKKFALIAGVAVLGVGIAFAGTVSVPFFLDRAPNDGQFPPTAREASFIALHNNLSVDLEVAVDYYDAGQDGTVEQQTPSPSNTFLLPANSTYSFRPIGNDATTEVNASVVPNMPGGEKAGSAIVSWDDADTGGVNEAAVQGRLVEVGVTGNAHSFLLPPGF
jgi:hypothetical protein